MDAISLANSLGSIKLPNGYNHALLVEASQKLTQMAALAKSVDAEWDGEQWLVPFYTCKNGEKTRIMLPVA